MLQDVKAIFNALAGIMNNPLLMRDTHKCQLEEEDFPEKFHQILFGAIHNLYEDGVEKITPIEIDAYLSNYPNQYRIYNENKGLDVLYKLEEMGQPENFNYHHNRIKKYSLLRLCKKLGIGTEDIYDDTLLEPVEIEKMQKNFDETPIEEIVKIVERKIVDVKEKFMSESVAKSSHMADNIEEILAEKLKAPSYGANMASKYLNFILRGSRKRKIYLKSGDTGSGKSRHGLADLLTMCIPEIWDDERKEWIQTGATGAGLFITTELDEEEIKMPTLCYIACVDEDKINNANLTKEEVARLNKAIKILEKTNIQFEELRDFDIQDIMNTIEKNVVKYGTEYVQYDYIHQSLKMLTSLSKAGVKGLREDQIILLMGIMLKDLCNEYDIWIGTATQLNKNYKEEGMLDESSIRGGRALADKMDAGMIMLPVDSKKDKAMVDAIFAAGYFGERPTHSINVYKNRGNRWKMIRVWVKIDLGTLRTKDLFCTDYDGNLIDNIQQLVIEHVTEDVKEESINNSVETEDILPESFDSIEKEVNTFDF